MTTLEKLSKSTENQGRQNLDVWLSAEYFYRISRSTEGKPILMKRSLRFYLTGFAVVFGLLFFALWLTGNLPFHFGHDSVAVVNSIDESKAVPAQPATPATPSAPEKPAIAVKESPVFVLESSAKQQWSFAQSRGKKVILHFWASWCPPCIEEIKQLLAAARDFEKLAPEFLFVAVSLDTKWEDALKLLPHEGLPSNMVSLLDADKKVAEQYGSFNYPETYLIDERGNRLTKLVGPQEWTDDEIVESIKSVFRSE